MRALCLLFIWLAGFSAAAEPPVLHLPPGESVLPGTSAEAKAERQLGYGPKLLRVPDAWRQSPASRGAGVRVAVLDTGVDSSHPWIKPRLKGVYNAIGKNNNANDRNGHGTHCCGIILEALPDCDLFPVKVLSDQGSGSVVDIAHGIDYAVRVLKCHVISLSLGGPGSDEYIPPALERAELAGTIVICAAGNDGPREGTEGYPARYRQAISTAACDDQRKVAAFSSRGPNVRVLAPGVQILSALPGSRQGAMSGTSMATPYVAALAGAWCATTATPQADRPAAFRLALRAACDRSERTNAEGFGLPDAAKLVSSPPLPPPPSSPPSSPIALTITMADLTEAKQAELRRLGVRKFLIDLDGERQPMPPPPSSPSSSSADVISRWIGGASLVVAVDCIGPPDAVRVSAAGTPFTPGRVYRLFHDARGPSFAELNPSSPPPPSSSPWSWSPRSSISSPPSSSPPFVPGLYSGSYLRIFPNTLDLFRTCPNCR